MWQSCRVWHAQLHTANLSRDKVPQQNRVIKLQVWHRSNDMMQQLLSQNSYMMWYEVRGVGPSVSLPNFVVIAWTVAEIWWFLSTHADRQDVDISFTVCLFVCLFVWLRNSPPRITLAASNFARRFIGVQNRESPIFVNFAHPEAQNRPANRLAQGPKSDVARALASWSTLARGPRGCGPRADRFVQRIGGMCGHWIEVSPTDVLVKFLFLNNGRPQSWI